MNNKQGVNMRYQALLLILICFAFPAQSYAGFNELKGKWMGRNAFYYYEVKPGGQCSVRDGASVQNYSCRITDDKILFGPFAATYKIEGDTLTITYPDGRVKKYTRHSAWLQQNPVAAFEDAIKRKNAKEAASYIPRLNKKTMTYCLKLYDLAYEKKDIQSAKLATQSGCDQVEAAKTYLYKTNSQDILSFFYSNGIFDINAQTTYGYTILMFVVGDITNLLSRISDHLSLVKFLLTYKPDMQVETPDGKNIYDLIPRNITIRYSMSDDAKKDVARRNQNLAEVKKLLGVQETAPATSHQTAQPDNKQSKRKTTASKPQPDLHTPRHPAKDRKQSVTTGKPLFKTPPVAIKGGCKSVTPAPPSGLKNLALQGKASQVSTGKYVGIKAEARLAIDGNTDGEYRHGSVAHTNANRNPWWMVDLGTSKSIRHIAIWNRTDHNMGTRTKNISVYVLDAAGKIVYQQGFCAKKQFPKPALMIDLPGDTKGQYVKIMLNKPGYLHLAEVQVFGE